MKFNRIKFVPTGKIGLLCLAIPFLAMFYMIASNALNFHRQKEYRVEITGYDPVNILTGHYITFRYKWPEGVVNECDNDGPCYACFSKNENTKFTGTEHLNMCESALQMSGGGFGLAEPQPDPELTKFHVPETLAPSLDRMLREQNGKFEVGILVYPDHTGQIRDLYINGGPFANFLK